MKSTTKTLAVYALEEGGQGMTVKGKKKDSNGGAGTLSSTY